MHFCPGKIGMDKHNIIGLFEYFATRLDDALAIKYKRWIGWKMLQFIDS